MALAKAAGKKRRLAKQPSAGQNVLGYEGILETWKVAWDRNGQADDPWHLG